MHIYIYVHRTCSLGPIRQAGGMIWVGRALIRQALGNSMYLPCTKEERVPTLICIRTLYGCFKRAVGDLAAKIDVRHANLHTKDMLNSTPTTC